MQTTQTTMSVRWLFPYDITHTTITITIFLPLMKNLKSLLVVLLLAGVVILAVAAGVRYFNTTCGELRIVINDKNEHTLLTEQQASALITKSDANPVGRKIRLFDRKALTAALQQNPWFNKIESTNVDGSCLTLHLSTKAPVAIVFAPNADPLILADNGQLLPDEPSCHNLPVINGDIAAVKAHTQVKKNSRLYNAYQIARTISSNPDHLAQYPQIFVRNDGQVELYSILGDHTVLLGNGEHLSEKFANLDAAYANGILDAGSYKSLDLRFHNRIYAVKSQTN